MDIKAVAGRRGVKRAFLGIAIAIAVYSVVGFLVLPPVVKSVLARQLSGLLHRSVTIRQVQVNPFVLAVKVSGFSISDRGGRGPFVSFDDLYLNFELASLYRGGPVLRDIILRSPSITVIRNEDLRYNFSDIIDDLASKPKVESKPLRYSLNNIRIVGGSVSFEDRPKQTSHSVRDLRVDVPFVSNLPYFTDTYVQPVFLAKINGTPVDLRGKTKPFSGSRETSFDVNVTGFDIPHYLEYVPAGLKFKIASALLDTRAVLSFREYKDKPPVLAFSGRVALRAVRITDPANQPILSFPLLDIGVVSSDVFAKKAELGTVLLKSPELRLVREKSGGLNVSSLFPADAETEKRAPKGTPPVLDAAEIRLSDGTVTFADLAVEKPFRTVLAPVDVVVRHFGNAPGKTTAVEAVLKTESSETFRHEGVLTVEPLGAEGTVALNGIPIRKYSPYFEKRVLFDVLDGVLDLSARYRYAQGGSAPETTVMGLSAALSSLRLRKRGEDADFLRIPVLSVREARIDPGKRTVTVGELSSRGGRLLVKREGDGAVNVATLVPPAGPPEKPAHPGKPAPSPDWVVSLGKVAVDRYAIGYEDRAPARPVNLSLASVTFSGENLSTGRNAKGKMSLRLAVGEEGTFLAGGSIVLNPLSAALRADIRGIDIVPLQPYFTERLKIAVTGGTFSAAGAVALESGADNSLRASWRGDFFVTKVATVDAATSEDFLKWNSLHLGGVRAQSNPLSVEMDEISLADFYSRIVVHPDGTLNVQQVVKNAPESPGGAAAAAPADNAATMKQAPRAVRIGVVTLQGGRIDFSDRFVKPNYAANLTEIGGRVSGLASEESALADVDLRGKLENVAPLEITGKINPLRDDLYVDLKVDFKDIDLGPMTPYSGRYAGYAIEKGKLSLGLKYRIARKSLDASNNVFIDQLTFGEKVESPDATKLPVRLAVALLKDRKGEIRLDLPVTGSLDDPKFSVWKVVVQVIRNILVKAATSPFALLGAVFGGGEELSYAEFPYGRAELDNAARAKLKTLEKVLFDRPALKLEIAGHADAVRDREGLRKEMFDRKIRAQKLKDLVKRGAASFSIDNVRVEPAEYANYLARAYKSETFPKPRNLIGMAKELPAPEMEKLIFTHIQVSDDDLRLLAQRRSSTVREHLLAAGRVEPERIFLVEPRTLSPVKKERVLDSRVDFVIK